ncbi:MAG TPA: hypothetical protein VMZ50_04155 [Phycisphaerae bacterium]|nr:hypothetical protein [Phycisphaerae bacterium]
MKRMLPAAIAAACLFCGCARTVSPEEFLYLYRRGDSAIYNAEGYKARYQGKEFGYHCLDVRYRTGGGGDWALLMHGGFRDETIRCPVDKLPETFPDDFTTLASQSLLTIEERANEPSERTRQYVREYLANFGKQNADPDGNADR